MSPRGRRPITRQIKAQTKRRIRPKSKSNHHQSAQNPHMPTLEDQRRQHNKIGLKVAHLGCGRAGTPLVDHLGPNLDQVLFVASLRSVVADISKK